MTLYAQYDDQQLVALLKTSDEAAFTELYERYWEKLFAMAFNRLRTIDRAEDAVHDVFTSLWKNREKTSIDSISAYLAVSLKFTVLRIVYRQQLNRDFVNQAQADGPQQVELRTDEIDIMDRLKTELEKLPEKCRVIFQYSRLNGYSNKEIAAELRISVKTVENQINNAQRALRVAFKHFFFFLL